MSSINERIRTAVTPLVGACEPHVYTGESDTYAVFDYVEVPLAFSDNEVTEWKAQITLELVLPLGINSIRLRRRLCSALTRSDFTAPLVTDVGDGTQQIWQFTFEGEMEAGDGEDHI